MQLLDILAASNGLGDLAEGVEAGEPSIERAREATEPVEEGPVDKDADQEGDIVRARDEERAADSREEAVASHQDVEEE